MKTKIISVFYFSVLIFGCAANKQTENITEQRKEVSYFPCEVCSDAINDSFLFSYPLRYVDDEWYVTREEVNEQTNQVENHQGYFERLSPFRPQSMNVYTEDELKEMKALVFCFIGKTKEEIKELLPAKEIITNGNSLFFKFNVGRSKGVDGGGSCLLNTIWKNNRL